MDFVTHAALGAAAAGSIAPARHLRAAALTGALAGALPDVDILITSSEDPLLNLEFHRHFTHSLVFVPVGAAIAAVLVWLLARRRIGIGTLYPWAFVGYLLAPLLDACTSYGTHLLWPFSTQPIAWSIIAVIDPLFSLAVFVPLLLALVKIRPGFARMAILLAAIGLAHAGIQRERAERHAIELAASRGHAPERLLVKPTLGNSTLWRSLYVREGSIHADAIRLGPFGGARTYPGESAPLINPERDLGLPADSRTRRDVARFVRFTDALVVRHPSRTELIGDARYAMLPTSIEPLWGIAIDPSAPDAPVRFETTRRLTPELRRRFLDMLLGR